jgi:hypothetical protein
MKGKVFRLIVINIVIVFAVFFLLLLALGIALPMMAVLEGALAQIALAAFAVAALIMAVLDLRDLLNEKTQNADEEQPPV